MTNATTRLGYVGRRPKFNADGNRWASNRFTKTSQAAERITAAYEAAGYTVEQAHLTPTYTRLNVTDPASGTQSKVELVAEFLHHTPVDSDLGPVLHRDDVAAGKTSALFTQAEVRDAIDVAGLRPRAATGR
ncbi:hypothetical protein [Streptomyces asiaticus]